MLMNGLAYGLLGAIWLLHWLPLPLLAALGRGLGLLLYALAGARRRVALRNVQLCLPELPERERRALVREHFQWLARSLLERALLWHASPARLKRLIHVEGDARFAEKSDRAVMWLVPHFLAVDVAGAACQLFQSHPAFDVYAPQSNPVLDKALLRGRARLGTGPREPVFALDHYPFDLRFYARLQSPVVVVADWAADKVAQRDDWRKELGDAGRFAPRDAASVLVPPTAWPARLCLSPVNWVVAAPSAQAEYAFLAQGEAVVKGREAWLWRLRTEAVSQLGCWQKPSADSPDR